jgi:hypothetical protein
MPITIAHTGYTKKGPIGEFSTVLQELKDMSETLKGQVTFKLACEFEEKIEQEVTQTYITPSGQSIYDNQIDAGEIILQAFQDGTRACMLTAEMQVGKTGTALYVALEGAKRLGFEQVIFVCGMSETCLRMQTVRRLKPDLPHVEVCFNPQLQDYVKQKGKTPRIFNPSKKTLLILDEAHYASDKDNFVQQFMTQIVKIDPARSYTEWSNKNVYYMSMDATPFSEHVSNVMYGFGKKVVSLRPGKGYRGVDFLINNNYVHASYHLREVVDFEKLYADLRFDQDMYYIIRISDQSYREPLQAYLTSQGVKGFKNLHSAECKSGHSIDFSFLSQNPGQATVVFIYNSLRAGYSPDYEYVATVFGAPSKQLDTNIQGELGRGCGYATYDPPQIYTSLKHAKAYLKYRQDETSYPLGYEAQCHNLKQSQGKISGMANQVIKINCTQAEIAKFYENGNRLKGNKKRTQIIDSIVQNFANQTNDPLQKEILGQDYVHMGYSTCAYRDVKDENGNVMRQPNKIRELWWVSIASAQASGSVSYPTSKEVEKKGDVPAHVPVKQRRVFINLEKDDQRHEAEGYGQIMIVSGHSCKYNTEMERVQLDPVSMFHPENALALKIQVLLKKIPIVKKAMEYLFGFSVSTPAPKIPIKLKLKH